MNDRNTQTDLREEALKAWLTKHVPGDISLKQLAGDASFTKYYWINQRTSQIIAMIATNTDSLTRFVDNQKMLEQANVRVPKIFAYEQKQGFALLEDLGDNLYSEALKRDPSLEKKLYSDAATTITKIQAIDKDKYQLPSIDDALLDRELAQLPKWYADNLCGKPLTKDEEQSYKKVCDLLKEKVKSQPYVVAHRDYHSRNLFVGEKEPAVIDFADALYAPQCYDIASLLHDLYMDFDDEKILDYLVRFWESARERKLPVAEDFGDYYSTFEWVSLQRVVKNLGQFVRLERENNRPGFIDYVPKCEQLAYSIAMRYRDLRPLALIIEKRAK